MRKMSLWQDIRIALRLYDTREIARRTRTLESLGVYRNAVFDLAGEAAAPPEALYGLKVTASLFPTLGVSPMLARNIRPEDERQSPAAESCTRSFATFYFHW